MLYEHAAEGDEFATNKIDGIKAKAEELNQRYRLGIKWRRLNFNEVRPSNPHDDVLLPEEGIGQRGETQPKADNPAVDDQPSFHHLERGNRGRVGWRRRGIGPRRQ